MASRKAEWLLDQYLLVRDWWNKVLREGREDDSERVPTAFWERNKARKALLDYIEELEAKAEKLSEIEQDFTEKGAK